MNIEKGFDINDLYLETVMIDEGAHYHNYLIAKGKTETLSYGSIGLVDWFALFVGMTGNNLIEMRSIASLVRFTGGDPFRIRRTDFSQLVYVNGFV